MTAIKKAPTAKNRYWVFAAIASVVVFLDQCSKWWAVSKLTLLFHDETNGALSLSDKLNRFLWDQHPSRSQIVTVLNDFWHFRYVENPGAAWGMLAGSAAWFRTPFFLIISLGAMAFILNYFRRTLPEQRLLRAALALVFGGAIGNFLDRIRLGYVIDFIDWHWYDKATWPTFNVADSAITIGVIILFVEMLWFGTPEAEK